MVIGAQQVRYASAAWARVPVSRRLLLRHIGHVDQGSGGNASNNRSEVGEVSSMFEPDDRYYRHPHNEQPYQSDSEYRADLRRQRRWLCCGKQQKTEHDSNASVDKTATHHIKWKEWV